MTRVSDSISTDVDPLRSTVGRTYHTGQSADDWLRPRDVRTRPDGATGSPRSSRRGWFRAVESRAGIELEAVQRVEIFTGSAS